MYVVIGSTFSSNHVSRTTLLANWTERLLLWRGGRSMLFLLKDISLLIVLLFDVSCDVMCSMMIGRDS
jgi:hypothetical protein